MDFSLSPDLDQLRLRIRDFVDRHCIPAEDAIPVSARLTRPTIWPPATGAISPRSVVCPPTTTTPRPRPAGNNHHSGLRA